jgi:hypothetical protein
VSTIFGIDAGIAIVEAPSMRPTAPFHMATPALAMRTRAVVCTVVGNGPW